MVNYQLYGIGHVIVDEYYHLSDDTLGQLGLIKGQRTLIQPEDLVRLRAALAKEQVQRQPGGSGANSIATAAMMGSHCVFAGRHFNDENGTLFDQNLGDLGILPKMEITETGPTGTCMVMITPDGERTMQTCTGVTDDLNQNAIDEAHLTQSQCLFLEGYLVTTPSALASAAQAIKFAKAHDVKVALSFADPAMVKFFAEGMHQLVELGLDVLFCNEEEALSFTGCDSLEEAQQALLNHTQLLCLTLGEKGARLVTQSQQIEVPAPKVAAIDTNGAGDSFAGAFLHAWLNGFELDRALELAVQTSAWLVTQTQTRISAQKAQQLVADFTQGSR